VTGETRAAVLLDGPEASGPALVLQAPISFWGGVDPKSGTIIDVRHPDTGKSIANTVLFLPGTIGSSSASSVMLELIRGGQAPAAIIFDLPDAILVLGLIVAREMQWAHPAAFQLDRSRFPDFEGKIVTVAADGRIWASTPD
jgi:uncharacterized protein